MKNLNEFIRRVQLPEVKLSDETRATMVAELERLRDDAEYRRKVKFMDCNDFEGMLYWYLTDDKSLWRHVANQLEKANIDTIEPPTLAEVEDLLK